MGYDLDLVLQALHALRDSKNYSPIGEVQKAIDWIDRKREQLAIDKAKAAQRQAQVNAIVEEHTVKAVVEAS